MPIAIVKDGYYARPIVVCDHCRGEIQRAAEGNYQWVATIGNRAPAPIYFTHKECCRPFERSQPLDDESLWAWSPLEALPVYLCRNLGIDFDGAAATADLMAI